MSASNGATQSSETDFRVFDHKANSFTLDLAELIISRKTITPDSSGYKLKLSMAKTAKWIHARGLSGAPLNQAQVGEGTDTIDVTEAYVSYMTSIGKRSSLRPQQDGKQSFDNGTKKSQDTVALAAMYRW